jgi:hypothetical protein
MSFWRRHWTWTGRQTTTNSNNLDIRENFGISSFNRDIKKHQTEMSHYISRMQEDAILYKRLH